MSIYRKIYKMLTRRQKVNFIWIFLIMIVSAVLSQMLPIAIGVLTDDVLSQDHLSFVNVLPFLLFILGITVTNEIIKVVRRLLVEDTSTRFEKEARTKAISSILHAPLSYFKKNMTGNIHGRLNRSLEGTTKLLKLMFMDFAPAIFNGVAAIIVIFSKLPFALALMMMFVIPIGLIIVFRQIHTQRGIRVELMNQKADMDGTMVELMNGIEVIRVLDSAEQETNRFDTTSAYLQKKEMKHHKAMAFYDCLKFVNEAVFTVLVIGLSVYLAGEGLITVGTVLTAYLSFTQLTTPLRELHRIFDELSESMVLAQDYFAIVGLNKDFSYLVKPSTSKLTHSDFITIRDVDFSYEKGKNILDNFQLTIKQGEFIGIAGPSGCGKSSLIRILTKLEPFQKGTITIDGKSLSSYTRSEIASMIALVPQSPFLISGTIYENVCYGLQTPATIEEVQEACHKAHIDDFIEKLPEKYDTLIAEGGGNLSGGQKQRIAIARIFLKHPKILILDEATSALDNTTEKKIQKSIEQLREDSSITILSIAHRLTTLENCDRIIVMNQGKIVQTGTYDELLQEEGIFQDMSKGVLK